MIETYLQTLVDSLLGLVVSGLGQAADTLKEARDEGASVWIVGNGGSAATASHFANDLTKMCGIKAFSLPDMTPLAMAYGNDNGWEKMFSDPLKKMRKPNDVLVAISCGGRSVNVLEAMIVFPPERRIVLTGKASGTPLSEMKARALISVQADDIRVQEDVHLAVCHMLAMQLSEDGRG